MGADIDSIESALETHLPGRWQRLGSAALAACPKGFDPRAGWKVRLGKNAVACEGIDHLLALIDRGFPMSQPRIVVPGLSEDGSWPHVEGAGVLCLKSTRIGFDPGERIAQHLAWAVELLNFDDTAKRREFQREFATYWERSRDGRRDPIVFSAVVPTPPSREICYFVDPKKNEIFVHDDRTSLMAWLRNTGRNPAEKEIHRTWMTWLDEPLLPKSFPQTGSDVLNAIPTDFLERLVKPATHLPVLLGASSETGPVWVAAEVSAAPEKELLKGFRPSRLPTQRIIQSMSVRPVRRLIARRTDGAYVHGRGRDPNYEALVGKRVAIVGCGALGGYVARLLAQAGVGHLVLIDHDILGTQNTARHVLGNRFVGQFKADALATMLREDFPHLPAATIFRSRVEKMAADRWEQLAACDLIVSSGIDFIGDAALNQWRLETVDAPAHVCVWTEPFALAGHGIALFGADNLLTAFDADGYPLIELTHWPEGVELVIAEAGCGNTFQPHGAIDLQRTVTMAARLALDVLQGNVTTSSRRTWQGDRDEVLRLGGTPSEEFQKSNLERTLPWNPSELSSEVIPT